MRKGRRWPIFLGGFIIGAILCPRDQLRQFVGLLGALSLFQWVSLCLFASLIVNVLLLLTVADLRTQLRIAQSLAPGQPSQPAQPSASTTSG